MPEKSQATLLLQPTIVRIMKSPVMVATQPEQGRLHIDDWDSNSRLFTPPTRLLAVKRQAPKSSLPFFLGAS